MHNLLFMPFCFYTVMLAFKHYLEFTCTYRFIVTLNDNYIVLFLFFFYDNYRMHFYNSFRESARNLSRHFLDRPLNALDTAVYWIEYVIKYGENSLRSPAMDLTWWQLSLIDVIGFLLFCIAIVVAIALFIMRFMLKMINGNYNKSSHSKKTN